MTLFVVVVFLHLLGALALFIGYGIEWTASALFRKAASAEQVRAWLRVFKVSPPLSGAGLAVLLLSGGHLAALSGTMRQGWILATLLGIALALVLGFALILPRMRAIRSSVAAGNEPVPASLRSQLADPLLLTAIRIRVLLAIAIVYLMVAKPLFVTSLCALGLSAVIGLLSSLSVWRPPAGN
jgi:uncharacterized membrane protein